MELSVIFPVHNEAGTIEKTISRTVSVLHAAGITADIICVENGSTDTSAEVVRGLIKKYRIVRMITSEKGWGNAVKRGLAEAKGRYVCYMVSDYQVDPEHIVTVFRELKKNPGSLVKVTRLTRENTQRLINSRIYNVCAKILFGFSTIDINATPKVIDRNLIAGYTFVSHNIAFDLELLQKITHDGVRVIDIPVKSMRRAAGASTTNWKSVLEMIRYMFRFRFLA